MKKHLRKILLFLSFGTFVLSLFSVLKYWNVQETLVDITKELHLHVDKSQIQTEIKTSIANGEFDDARMYLDIARSNQYDISVEEYENKILLKDTRLRQITSQASNFAEGFFKGESSNAAGLAGAVTADFSVVGDVRDLHKQYTHYSKGENVNEAIVVLSGAGIGLTALTVGSLGAAAPAKTGTSIMKLALKTQRLTTRFQKQIIKLGRKIFDWQTFTRLLKQDKSINSIKVAAKQAYKPEAVGPLKNIADNINSIRKSTSTIDAVHLLKYVETTDDLKYIEKLSLKYGSKTKGLMKLLGKGAIRTVKVLKKTTALIISLLSSVLSGFFSLLLMFFRRTII